MTNTNPQIDSFSEALEQILAKALLDVGVFSKLPSDEWNSKKWCEFEVLVGNIFHCLLRTLLNDPITERKNGEIPYIAKKSNIALLGNHVTLGAINQRGLFRQNGRQTIVEPCSTFLPSAEPVKMQKRHDELHQHYMSLVGKEVSINQLFMLTTRYRSISLEFNSAKDSINIDRKIQNENDNVCINISQQLTDLLASNEIKVKWKEEIKQILNGKKVSSSSIPDYDFIELIKKEPRFLSECLKLYIKKSANANDEEAINHCRNWIRSFIWLQFYCQPDVGGKYFYTFRLPAVIDVPPAVLPESSISIISNNKLTDIEFELLKRIPSLMEASGSFTKLKSYSKLAFNSFVSRRYGGAIKDLNHKLAPIKATIKKVYRDTKNDQLRFDFDRFCFLLKVARKLVGRSHEGQSLRFCFISGLGFERVDAETSGYFTAVRAGLFDRWLHFLENAEDGKSTNWDDNRSEEVANVLASWIKSNDLQLQRPGLALYFEEIAEQPYPVPLDLIQLFSAKEDEVHPVATETELRHVLLKLTVKSNLLYAILTEKSGLTAFLNGKCVLLPCSSRDKWDKKIQPIVNDEHVLIHTLIQESLKQTIVNWIEEDDGIATNSAEIISLLCEAVVSLGHGCMLTIRSRKTESMQGLPPLNPVWLLRSEIKNLESLRAEIEIFALMAALDGAAELILPKSKDDPFGFTCRRFAQTSAENWIWKDTPEVPGNAEINRNNEEDKGKLKKLKLSLLGKGTRHHTALVLSMDLGNKALVITVSADGPVTIFHNGEIVKLDNVEEIRYKP